MMTLRKQLGLWFGGALICVAAFQGVQVLAVPREKLSAEEVSRRFMLFITSDDVQKLLAEQGVGNLISSENEDYLSTRQINTVVAQLSESYAASAFKTRKAKDKSGGTIVRLIPLKEKPSAELVCVEEEDGYKIDLVATYGRWNKLSGVPLAQQIYDFSGGILPDLPRTPRIELSICQSNLKQIGLGLLMYSQDYDEIIPSPKDWDDKLLPYLKDEQLYNCPTVRPKIYGYALNTNLSEVNSSQVETPSMAVTFFDSQQLEKGTGGGQSDIAYRHKVMADARFTGANIAFADGHVQYMPSGRKWDDSSFTFTPKLRPIGAPPTYAAPLPDVAPAPPIEP